MKESNRNSLPLSVRFNSVGRFFALSLLSVALLLALDADAVGLRLPNQDPEGIARGNAFVATADNPSAIYYNPAGITQLPGDQFRAGLYFISANTEYSSPFGTANTDAGFQVVPQMYYTHGFDNCPLTLGLGVYSPYGLGLEWENAPPFSPIARKGKVLYATVNPVIAWRIHPTLSLAVGPTLNYADAELETSLFKFKGNDFGAGFNAGLLWQPHQQWSFGLKYHYQTDLDLEGDSEFIGVPGTSTPTHAKAHFPQFVTAGISYRPTTNWNFEFDVDWTDWDSLNNVNFDRGAAGGSVNFLFNYRSSWMYEVGATRQLGKGWFVSVGYIFSENSSPDADFNPIVPDSDLHLGSVGFGHHGKRWDWAIGYHFAYGERDVTGSNSPFGIANGHYKTFNNAVNVSATFKF